VPIRGRERVLDLICQKCGAKWTSEMLERKRLYACPCCAEPGLRYMDAKGTPTDEAFPREAEG
jgi:hypothetical protein